MQENCTRENNSLFSSISGRKGAFFRPSLVLGMVMCDNEFETKENKI